ncbi:MAG TPA: transglycosylase SLT domain-containing protein [Caulobacteraceae bacterium]|jgi:hypothetical protein
MSVQGIRGVVEGAIQRASEATGVDFSFLLGTAKRESGYNPRAQAASSSAAGLFQFVEQTWLATLKKHGAKYGYARYADLISRGPDGRYHVGGGEARRAVLDLRLDARAASLMAGELTSDHASYLRGRVGRDPSSGELYAAHFLGPQGSARLIEAMSRNPGMSAAALFPDAAAANRPIFYREGRAATVAEVYANLTQGGHGRAVSAPSPAVDEDQGFARYAGARRLERIQAERVLVDMVLRGPASPDRAGGYGSAMLTSDMLRVLSDAREGKGRS